MSAVQYTVQLSNTAIYLFVTALLLAVLLTAAASMRNGRKLDEASQRNTQRLDQLHDMLSTSLSKMATMISGQEQDRQQHDDERNEKT